jgi:hypothetical protein
LEASHDVNQEQTSSLHAAIHDVADVAKTKLHKFGPDAGPALLPRVAILAMSFVVLGIPITDIWRFLLLLASVIAVAFGTPSVLPKRWLVAAVIAIVAVGLASFLPVPYIEEGENVYIPLGDNLGIFEQQLPASANAVMKAEFDRTYLASDESSGVPVSFANQGLHWPGPWPRHWIEHALCPSADALWQHPKYSRIVNEFSFGDQDQARVGAINRLAYNFHLVHDHAKRLNKLINPAVPTLENNLNLKAVRIAGPAIDRRRMPFFVMAEVNPSLVNGRACWRGDVLWEQQHETFDLLRNASWTCRQITEQDLGKQLYAFSIGSPVSFAITPPLKGRVLLWVRDAVRALAVLAIIGLLVNVRLNQVLLPIGAAVSTLVTTTILWPEYLVGFFTLEGGNDGLTHESLGFDIAQALHNGNWAAALRGGESVFYYMPGLRYFRAIEQFLFGETNFGVVLCTMFLPVFLYYFLRRLLPSRWSMALVCIFLFTPIFERFGFAHFVYLREMIKGFPEPLGYTAFLGALALIAQYVPTNIPGERPGPMPTGWIAFALALSVALRPNLALPAVLILAMAGYWLLIQRRWGEATMLALGFAPVLLISLHNWYFGHVFVPLTSSAFTPDNLTAPPSVYWMAIAEMSRLDFSGEGLAQVVRQLSRWNEATDLYRVVAVLAVVWVFLRANSAPWLRGLALVTLSMQAILLFYLPNGRYALLAWLLVFIIVLIEIRSLVTSKFVSDNRLFKRSKNVTLETQPVPP